MENKSKMALEYLSNLPSVRSFIEDRTNKAKEFIRLGYHDSNIPKDFKDTQETVAGNLFYLLYNDYDNTEPIINESDEIFDNYYVKGLMFDYGHSYSSIEDMEARGVAKSDVMVFLMSHIFNLIVDVYTINSKVKR